MKRIIFIVTILVSIVIINNLIRSIYDLWHKKDLIVKTQQDLIRQKQENNRLKSELSYVGSREFIEKEARNKLLLVKPGEQQVLIPQNLIKESKLSEKENKDEPNWRKWWELFF
ncbi:MAG: septum formation initiator family protein [Patescibacteria group bacterium]